MVGPPALARSDVDSKFSYKFFVYMKFSFEVNDWSLEWTVVFMYGVSVKYSPFSFKPLANLLVRLDYLW